MRSSVGAALLPTVSVPPRALAASTSSLDATAIQEEPVGSTIIRPSHAAPCAVTSLPRWADFVVRTQDGSCIAFSANQLSHAFTTTAGSATTACAIALPIEKFEIELDNLHQKLAPIAKQVLVSTDESGAIGEDNDEDEEEEEEEVSPVAVHAVHYTPPHVQQGDRISPAVDALWRAEAALLAFETPLLPSSDKRGGDSGELSLSVPRDLLVTAGSIYRYVEPRARLAELRRAIRTHTGFWAKSNITRSKPVSLTTTSTKTSLKTTTEHMV